MGLDMRQAGDWGPLILTPEASSVTASIEMWHRAYNGIWQDWVNVSVQKLFWWFCVKIKFYANKSGWPSWEIHCPHFLRHYLSKIIFIKTSSRLLGQQGQLICARIFLCGLILLMRGLMGLMEIYEDCGWCGLTRDSWRPDSWLQLREHSGNCIQIQTAPLLTLKCPWSMEDDHHLTIRDVSEMTQFCVGSPVCTHVTAHQTTSMAPN